MYTAKPPPKKADPIYRAKEHVLWRRAVLARAGGACEWVELGGRRAGQRCGRTEVRMFADHIKELKDGGERFALANGQCLCGSHHTLKTNIERAKRNGFVSHD
jgi:hypothetical protein